MIVMARAPASLHRSGSRPAATAVSEVDLEPFILSGGAAYCMTLRLDRTSAPRAAIRAAE